MKFINMLGLAMLAALAASCAPDRVEAPTVRRVNAAVVKPADAGRVYTATGTVNAVDRMQIAFRVSGTIDRIYVKEGQRVSRGQLLAAMDPRDYEVQLQAAEAEYASVKAEAERVIQLYEEQATTADNYDKARYGLRQITSKLQHARDQVADTKIYSPIDGYIQEVIFKANETVGAGMGVVSIVGDGAMEVEASLPARVAENRRDIVGAVCRLGSSGKEWPVTLTGLRQKGSASQTYTATFSLPAEAKPLAGTSCTVTITLGADDEGVADNVVIPSSALTQSDGQSAVYVCHDGRLELTAVNVDRVTRGGEAYITAGVAVGDTIVISGLRHINDGDEAVPVIEGDTPSNAGGLL